MKLFYLTLFALLFIGTHAQKFQHQLSDLENQRNYPAAYQFLSANVDSFTCTPCHSQLADLAYKSGLLKRAVHHSSIATSTDSNNIQNWVIYTNAALKRGNYSQSLNGAKTLVKLQPEIAYYHKLLASCYLSNGEASQAMLAYQKALNLNPEDEDTGLALCNLYYKLELYQQAENLALQFIAKDSLHHGFLAMLPKVYYQQKEYRDAKNASLKLFGLKDSSIQVLKIYTSSQLKTKEFEAALSSIRYLESINEMSDALYFQKGYTFENIGQLDSAEFYYSIAIDQSMSPNAGQYHLQYALTLDQQSNFKEAIPQYKKAYEIMRNETILYYLARAYDNYYKDKSIAMNYYERYLEESDTIATPSKVYASERISQIKTVIHMQLDSL